MRPSEKMLAAVREIREAGPEVPMGMLERMGNSELMYQWMMGERTLEQLEVREATRKPWGVVDQYTQWNDDLHSEVVRLCEERAFTMGSNGMVNLGRRVWPALSKKGRARYLAGKSSLHRECLPGIQFQQPREMEVEWEPRSLAEYCCNAIYQEAPERALQAVAGLDVGALAFPWTWSEAHLAAAGTAVPREDSRRVVDVIFEGALRRWQMGVMRRFLERGADANLLTAQMSRAQHVEWSSALTRAMVRYEELFPDRTHENGGIWRLLMEYHPRVEGHPAEGLNKPLFTAWNDLRDDAIEVLLERGARFEGGHFAGRTISDGERAKVLPTGAVPASMFGVRTRSEADLQELWEAVSHHVPLAPWHAVPWYRTVDLGGPHLQSYLRQALELDALHMVERHEGNGLPTQLTLPDVVLAMQVTGSQLKCLTYLLKKLGVDARAVIPRLRNLVGALATGTYG